MKLKFISFFHLWFIYNVGGPDTTEAVTTTPVIATTAIANATTGQQTTTINYATTGQQTTTINYAAETEAQNSNLSCYDCEESFTYVWEPYTECQAYPDRVPLRPCLDTEKYCMVERVSQRSTTVSIIRSCTDECWHGCYASGFGLTLLTCTSCCMTPGCNVGNTANMLGTSWISWHVSASSLWSFLLILSA